MAFLQQRTKTWLSVFISNSSPGQPLTAISKSAQVPKSARRRTRAPITKLTLRSPFAFYHECAKIDLRGKVCREVFGLKEVASERFDREKCSCHCKAHEWIRRKM
ncbi:hypothetical protein AVEN_115191-1 [Araneus ventricosus]|uniref:Uncharacterized protein n=1 Tax=Araneus ventricosus TaxID=182803 RepID=A0A4Y1ZYE7_ARAVE|nr:hypothetical protein AVEN_115191-1 [Araneus ventricosus]